MFAKFIRSAKQLNRVKKTWEIILQSYKFSPSPGLMEHAQRPLFSMADFMDEHNLAVFFLGIYGESIEDGAPGAKEQFTRFKEKINSQIELGLVNDAIALKEFRMQAERLGINCAEF